MRRMVALLFLLLLLLTTCLTGCAGAPQSRESGATAVVSVLGVEPAGEGIRLLAAAEGRGGEAPSGPTAEGTPRRRGGGSHQPGGAGGELRPCGAPPPHPDCGRHPAGPAELRLSGAPAEHGDPAVGGPGGHPGGELFRGGGHRPADDGDPVPGEGPADLRPPHPPAGRRGPGQGGAAADPRPVGGGGGAGLCRLCPLPGRGHHPVAHRPGGPGGRPPVRGEDPLDRAPWGRRPSPSRAPAARCTRCGRAAGWWAWTSGAGWRGSSPGAGRGRPPTPPPWSGRPPRPCWQALDQLQAAGADAAGLLGRAGLSNPFRWDALNGQWQGVFPTLPATCTVTVHVDQGR